ncbi:MerR family transcriptional regulator [Sphaerisporangium album]|uniref:MerR family transcriptional regulator n=1 Tax=Sphaerisporangium album TaxID=509200 RepID=A0A367FSK5_9ACTN|nr:MerR family transcriptional regulator [Sphaerisporangium album]RCG32772.1 MerR family transcriptional regulator [Sphaerisporangium album]
MISSDRSLMTIGDFSRATRLSAKALRHYHREGLLAPASVDPVNGYRLYTVDQLIDAQVIRTLRELDVPVDEIREIVSTSDVASRAARIEGHAARLEARLRKTSDALSSLRRILDDASPRIPIAHRTVPPTDALVVQEVIDLPELSPWFDSAMRELARVVEAERVPVAGAFGGLWSTELFLDGRGMAALYAPVDSGSELETMGRVRAVTLPAVELAVATSHGPDESVRAVYAALGEHVARHELSIDAPIRETYLKGLPGPDADAIVEIGWPVFRVTR